MGGGGRSVIAERSRPVALRAKLRPVIGDIFQPTHLLFVLVIALLVLGPKRLPEVGRSLGRGLRDFRTAISGEDDDAPAPLAASSTVAAPTVAAPTEPAVQPAAATQPMPPAPPVDPTS
jgi:sec-independent protein translocase protein TatA